MSKAEVYRVSLRLPPEDHPDIESVVRESGTSINDVLILAIRKGLPDARRALCADRGRVCAVEPLPDQVLDRIYHLPDDDEGGTRVFQRAQAVEAEA